MSRVVCGVVFLAVATGSAQAQGKPGTTPTRLVAQSASSDWAYELLDKRSIDFGVIAKGSDAKTTIRVSNNLKRNVRIRSVAATCVCSGAAASKTELKPGEEGFIEVSMNCYGPN